MTKANEAAALAGLRTPAPAEHRAIAAFMTGRYTAAIRTGNRLASALTAGGVALLFAAGRLGPAAVLLGAAAFAGACLAIAGKNRDRAALRAFQNGAYRVLDGRVREVGSNCERPGYVLVRFVSAYGQPLPVWLPVLRQGAAPGTPLLLAVWEAAPPQKRVIKAFTPTMLAQPAPAEKQAR